MEFWAIFLAGLLGGGHCLGMCGGVVALMAKSPFALAYNFGRIAAYILVGALLGALGEVGFLLADSFSYRIILFAFANFLMLAMGVYLLGVPHFIAPFEKMGGVLWRKIAPFAQKFLPPKNFKTAFSIGFLWGFLPCGLLYSAFAAALASASFVKGALLMASFGLGTLPNLIAAPFLLQKLSPKFRQIIQKITGVFLMVFGAWGFYKIANFL